CGWALRPRAPRPRPPPRGGGAGAAACVRLSRRAVRRASGRAGRAGRPRGVDLRHPRSRWRDRSSGVDAAAPRVPTDDHRNRAIRSTDRAHRIARRRRPARLAVARRERATWGNRPHRSDDPRDHPDARAVPWRAERQVLDFELSGTDLGSMVPDKRDLARMALMDFILLHSNEWFLLPVDLAPGDLHQIDQLVVHDVFGTLTPIGRADREAGSVGLWSMFTTSIVGQPPSATADFFVLPPSAVPAIPVGTGLEEVGFARDEMANMVWALEQATENAIGRSWPGHERDVAHNDPASGGPSPQPLPAGVDLRYRIQSRVPEHWIPFLPVAIDPA